MPKKKLSLSISKLGSFVAASGGAISNQTASSSVSLTSDGFNKLLVSKAGKAIQNASGAELTLADVTKISVSADKKSIEFGAGDGSHGVKLVEQTSSEIKGQFAVLAKDGVAVYNFVDGSSSGDLTVTLVAVINGATGIDAASGDITFA